MISFKSLDRFETSNGFIPELDGLRFIAIFSVLLFHLNGRFIEEFGFEIPILTEIMKTGYFGVHLFFGISGFVLSNQILSKGDFSYGRYLFKRLKRIEPPFLIAICIQGVLLAYFLKPEMRDEIFSNMKTVLLYFSNYSGKNLINGVTWSLEVEVQFYLILPILLWMPSFFKKVPFILIIFLVASYSTNFSFRSVFQDFPYFLSGILVALNNYYKFLQIKEVKNIIYIAAFVLLLFALNQKTIHMPFLREFRVVLLFLLLNNFLGYHLRSENQFVFNKWLVRIGGMCYSIYLWHIPIFSVLVALLLKLKINVNLLNGGLFFTLVLFLTIVCCIPFYLLFEKPFMSKRLK